MTILKDALSKIQEIIKLRNYKADLSSYHTEYLGSNYGGWAFCPEHIDDKSVVYSFGIGEDISWDEALINKYGLTIHGFDPTPRSIEFVKRKNINNFILYPVGISSSNGSMDFFLPENPNHVSHSLVEKANSSDGSIRVEVKTLDTIMDELGHKKIDILKMDIEGSEYEVVGDMLHKGIYPNQVLIEFHHRFQAFKIDDTIETINNLIYHSYKITHISSNKQEFSFVRL